MTEIKEEQLNVKECTKNLKLSTLSMFGGIEISTVIENDKITWYKFADLEKALEFNSQNLNISDILDAEYYISFEKLMCDADHDIKNMDPKTIFVNEIGMMLFIVRAETPKAEPYARWLCGTVLPSIRKYNKYILSDTDNHPFKK